MMDRGYWANLARMPGLHPYSFERHPGIFMTTESQDLGLAFHLKDGAQHVLTSKRLSRCYHRSKMAHRHIHM